MQPTRNEVKAKIDSTKEMIAKNQLEPALAILNQCYNDITKHNFWPLMTYVLDNRVKINKQSEKYTDVCHDMFLRLSPYISLTEQPSLFKELLELANSIDPVSITYKDTILNLLPFKINIHYEKERIISGQSANYTVFLTSLLPDTFTINDVSLVFEHDNNQQVIESLGTIEFHKKKLIKISKEHKLPPSISFEKVVAVIFKIKSITYRLEKCFSPVLHISPDASACKIEVKMPPRCIAGVTLPFSVVLTADEQKLEKVGVHFQSSNPMIPVTINGQCGDIKLEEMDAELPDIEPFQSLTIDCEIKCTVPVYNPVVLTVRFGTALAGNGDFFKDIPFYFVTPFNSTIKLFDSNFQMIENAVIEIGDKITVETTLDNNLDIPVTIKSITGTVESIDNSDVPIELFPGESFSFLSFIEHKTLISFNVSYKAEGLDDCIFYLKSSNAEEFSRSVKFSFDAPFKATRFQPFNTKLTIEKIDNTEEVTIVMLDVTNSPCFFMNGPSKKAIYLFRNQKKEINLEFLPLEPGSNTLPPISLNEVSSKNYKPKVFIAPIVVTFQ